MAAAFNSLTVNFEQSVRSHMPREKSASIITVSPTAAIPINNEKQKFLQYLIWFYKTCFFFFGFGRGTISPRSGTTFSKSPSFSMSRI